MNASAGGYGGSGGQGDRQRVLPHNLSAEASILGGVLLRNDLFDLVDTLEVADFYHLKHKVVFAAMRSLQHDKRPIDVTTLEAHIEREGKLDAIGGISFLGELALHVPTPDNVMAYARIVQGHSMMRRLAFRAERAIDRVYNWQGEPDELLGETLADIQSLEKQYTASVKKPGGRLMSIPEALSEAEHLAKAPIYTTPYESLNDAIGFGGFLGTQNYTIAAGTGRGKTSFVSDLAAHSAQTVPVLVASYEMKPFYFVARKAAGVLGVHSNEILRGGVSMRSVMAAMPFPRYYLLHKPSLTELREAVDYIAQKHGQAPLVIVDYLQKLADQIARSSGNPDLRIATSEASDTLLELADRSTSAVIAVSAIGRGSNKRTQDPRKLDPYELVDVAKESGAVEYDGAGLIVLSLSNEHDGEERVATITLAKARFGRECHIGARYNGRRGTWRDCGPVDAMPKFETPKPGEGSRRGQILRVLAKGPLASKTKIFNLAGGNKKTVLAEIDQMVDDGVIEINAGSFCLRGWHDGDPANAAQTAIPEVE